MQITVQSAKQNLGIEAAPHLHAPMTTQKIMLYVLIALIPAYGTVIYFFGFALIWQFLLCALTAYILELICAALRSKNLKLAAKDLSGIVTAAILALTIPPLLPWHLSIAATFFAIVIVKQVFGGLGMNIFNPAMAGFIFLVISAPGVFYSTWLTPAPAALKVATIDKTAGVIFMGDNPKVIYDEIVSLKENPDVLTGATFLESIKTARKAGTVNEIKTTNFTSDDYFAYLCLAIAITVGGLFLIIFKIILFQMPLAFLLTVGSLGGLWHFLDPTASISALEHLLFGGTMLGAFFIITDPVTNCGTSKGRILFAILSGFLLILIRINGSYSDSVAFAVMLSNAAAPLIDVLTRRRPFGIGYRKGGLD